MLRADAHGHCPKDSGGLEEGDFFGFGGVWVSSVERSFVNEVRQVLHIA